MSNSTFTKGLFKLSDSLLKFKQVANVSTTATTVLNATATAATKKVGKIGEKSEVIFQREDKYGY